MKIAIITSTYNRRKLISEAIESVQLSKLEPYNHWQWEHIIYDDGSTDLTSELFENHNWKNLSYLQSNLKQGQSVAKNKAIDSCDADWILVLDSDDLILERTLHNFIKATVDFPNCDWFISDAIRVDAELRYLTGQDNYGWPHFQNNEQVVKAIFNAEHYLQTNVLFRKQLYNEAGKFDTKLERAEDLDLYLRFLFLGKVPKYLASVSHLMRKHEQNITKGINLDIHKQDLVQLKIKYQKQLFDLGL